MFAQGAQGLGERIGRMRVIDDGRGLAAAGGSNHLHASGRRNALGQHPGCVAERGAEREQAGDDHQRILRVEAAEQAGLEFHRAETSVELHRDAARIQGDFGGVQLVFGQPPRVAGADPQCGDRHASRIGLGEFAAEGIAHVEDDVLQVGNMEQARLGRPVVGHGPVIVQVITAQIGERGAVETYAGDAILIEGLRRHFHRHLTHAGGAQLRELPVQCDGIGRGEGGRRQRCDAAPADGTHVGRLESQAIQALRQQVSAGGLAVGSRDSGDAQLCRRPIEEAVGDAAHQILEPGDGRGEYALRQLRKLGGGAGLPQHHGGAARRGLRRELQPMHGAPGQREEQAAGTYLAAVERDIPNVAHLVGGNRRDAVEQPLE